MRWFAEHQPVTAIVDTLRGLLGGTSVGNGIWVALAWCVSILVATAVYRHRLAG